MVIRQGLSTRAIAAGFAVTTAACAPGEIGPHGSSRDAAMPLDARATTDAAPIADDAGADASPPELDVPVTPADVASPVDGAVPPVPVTTVSFTEISGDVLNPGRGFHGNMNLGDDPTSVRTGLGRSLVRMYVRLDPYIGAPLPSSLLDAITASLAQSRAAGLEVILRFTYNFPSTYPSSDPDAPESRVLAHITQLTPLLTANADVIAVLQAGFIGDWGEWHDSTNGLDTRVSAKTDIADALLTALPTTRMIQLRYPNDIESVIGSPVASAQAFTGTSAARVGHHNDCFLDGADDGGTYGRTGSGAGASVASGEAYLAAQGLYAPVGGETCAPSPPRSQCPTALTELANLHFSYMNGDYEPTVLAGWRSGGCYDEIARRLGYRLVLSSASYTPTLAPGGVLAVSATLANGGFAAMYNPRAVYVVLDGGGQRYGAALPDDPRRWAAGGTFTVAHHVRLPASAPAGTYRLSLWLPEPDARDRGNAAFAVRFANNGTWDGSTGYNVISTAVTVDSHAAVTSDPGAIALESM